MHLPFPIRRSRGLAGGLTLAAGLGLVAAPAALAQSNAPADAHAPGHSHAAKHSHAPSHSHGRGHARGHSHAPAHPHHPGQSHSPGQGDGHGQGQDHGHQQPDRTVGVYAQRNLSADTPGTAELTDPDLINAWGLSFGPASSAWVSDAGTNKASLYRGAVGDTPVTKVPITVSIPGQVPTGQVFNGGDGFVVRSGNASGAPRFLFATVTGTISGWNANVPGPDSMEATAAVTIPGAVFTGLAISHDNDRLYAADFHNAKVDVFDRDFAQVNNPGAFQDSKIPDGFAPFGIEATDGKVVVTYAKQDPTKQFDVAGAGNGFVDVYSESGRLLQRLAAHGPLNSPWGIAQAPKDFGAASGALLIGNFGDGRVTAYSQDGRMLGQIGDTQHKPLTIPGLWALKFGNGVIGDHNELMFTAGPDLGTHGLFGKLDAATR